MPSYTCPFVCAFSLHSVVDRCYFDSVALACMFHLCSNDTIACAKNAQMSICCVFVPQCGNSIIGRARGSLFLAMDSQFSENNSLNNDLISLLSNAGNFAVSLGSNYQILGKTDGSAQKLRNFPVNSLFLGTMN